MAQVENSEKEKNFINENTASNVSTIEPEIQIFNLYTAGHISKQPTCPFIHQLNIDLGDRWSHKSLGYL